MNSVNLTKVTSVILNFKKETPGTYVFENKDADTMIPTIYIKKSAFPDGNPTFVELTVAIPDAE